MKDQSSSRQPSAGIHVVQPDHLGTSSKDLFQKTAQVPYMRQTSSKRSPSHVLPSSVLLSKLRAVLQ